MAKQTVTQSIEEAPRFEVCHKGMSQMQAGREPWQLIKELVSNSFDEESVTRTEVTVDYQGQDRTLIKVSDNGKGFKDIRDAWTLMKATDKRAKAETRGRFNLGEKEVMCIAIEGSITTLDTKIEFPAGGGRNVITLAAPIQGVVVECLMPWSVTEAGVIVTNLKKLLPPHTYIVNGEQVEPAKPIKTVEHTLSTVLWDEPTNAFRQTHRKAKINIMEPANGETWIYEMGVPIQLITCPWSVDIGQKVPMPPNRDTVRDSYLQSVYAVVLNAMTDAISSDDASTAWVRAALESKTVTAEAAKKVITKRYGDKVVLWSRDNDANIKAREAGYEVVHPRTLSAAEREVFAGAGLPSAVAEFGSTFSVGQEARLVTKWDDGMKLVVAFSKRMGLELLGDDIKVEIINEPQYKPMADFCAATRALRFNLPTATQSFFDRAIDAQGLISRDVVHTVAHEIAHIKGNGHDDLYKHTFGDMAANMVHLAINKPNLFKATTYQETK